MKTKEEMKEEEMKFEKKTREEIMREYNFKNFEPWSLHEYEAPYTERWVGWEDCPSENSEFWNNNFYRDPKTGLFEDCNYVKE